MSKSAGHRQKDLLGVKQLTVEAVVGITDIVEALHQTILTGGGILGEPGQTRTRGISGGVYKSVRTLTRWVGKGLDLPLGQLAVLLDERGSSSRREAVLSALNGVLGDYLHASNNPLAIPMQFRAGGKTLHDEDLATMLCQGPGKLAVMVHGSSMNDLQWQRNGYDHGSALSRDLGIPVVYLHYNSGRHISENGRQFSYLLQRLTDISPKPLKLMMVAHSMGGLVSRSACHYARQLDHGWLGQLDKLVFLGSPHLGAPLEKLGNWIDRLLAFSPYSAPFARLGKIRSSGITDLRHGNLLDEDWQGKDRFRSSRQPRNRVPLPGGVACYCIAGAGSQAGRLRDGLIGDGLVSVKSALGRHHNPALDLGVADTHQWIGRGIGHQALLSHPEVYVRLRTWLDEAS